MGGGRLTALTSNTHRFQSSTLPQATCQRWQPIRGGLLNLYLYDYEEFRYENGHLILRGNNGTGKSRVLALQLPFLFDGRLSTNRVEPDADPSKRMDWNLLMGRHNERQGYTWIEFGKCTPVGGNGATPATRYITLGCGLSATKNSGMREPWFFVTDQRIGEDLFLQSDAGHAISKSALSEAIGEQGKVYTTSRDYRQAVDEALFGLGKQRYEAMVDLLIQLRRPQLSRHLDEKMLARVLGEALPPPSEHMINDVAESFRGLESDRMEMSRFQSARDGVDGFLMTYRRYAGIASRRRADDVRTSHNRYEYASKELRKAERDNAAAKVELDSASTLVHSFEVKNEEINSRLEALRSDPKMRSAETINQASEREQQAANDLATAKSDVTTTEERIATRCQSRKAALEEADAKLKETKGVAKQAKQLAGSSELATQHDAAFAELKLELSTDGTSAPLNTHSIRKSVENSISVRTRGCEQLNKRNEDLRVASEELRRSKTAREEASIAVENAIADETQCEDHRQAEVNAFLEAYEMWRRDSDELVLLSADELAASVEDWSQRPDGTSPVHEAVSRAKLRAQESLSKNRIELQQQSDEWNVQRGTVIERVTRLQHGYHEPPELPLSIDESKRASRSGAPFWSLVDFQSSCPSTARANIEAGLAAAGFLNAWVTSDGAVLTSDFEDVLFTLDQIRELQPADALSSLLRPADDGDSDRSVANQIVDALLGQIGLQENATSTWVSVTGHWRNGPLRGHAIKQTPQFIGHEARENNRLAQLTLAEDELQRIESEIERVQTEISAIRDREGSVAKQADAVPADGAIRTAANKLAFAHQKALERRRNLAGAEQQVAQRRSEADRVRQVRDNDAQDLGLTEWAGRIGELQQNVSRYQQCLAELWPSFAHFNTLRGQFLAAAGAVREAKQDAERCTDTLYEREKQHAKAVERLRTLKETIGAEADEILRQIADAEESRSTVKTSLEKSRKSEIEAGKQVARTDERIESRQEVIEIETSARAKSCADFQRLCELGLLQIASGEEMDEDATHWSTSKTVEVARKTETTFSQINADDGAWDRIQQNVNTTIQELNSALSQRGFTSILTTTDGLYLVTVPYQGKDRSVNELRDLLSEEVEQRQLVLDEREREIIENHLIGEVATKLHEQIHDALELVEKMNAEIQKRPMSTGMMLKFDWKPDDTLSSGIVVMCRKLLGATGTWSPDERAAIGRYLQDHIKDVRAAREAGAWHEHLAEALDYRLWHRFWVMRKQETGWKKLTKRTHGTGSGGEKAVALTIPQFAAAAAHYSSARDDAPRLILLDEAFVGIDPDMRGKCMELINVFDLDFLLTSESEWGCYPGLPGVAIYQLSTRTGFDAVFTTRWVWNGKQKLRDELALPTASRSME